MGRLEEIKGPQVAIEVARQANQPLILAGNIPPDAASRRFFAQRIEPHLDGDRIRYIGPVDDAQKNRLLGTARAFLMPILWEEPFGIVMAEALACGTPVIGLARGAVPEVVLHGHTGFVCESAPEMVDAVGRVHQISREACRRDARNRFSSHVIGDQYEGLYERAIAG